MMPPGPIFRNAIVLLAALCLGGRSEPACALEPAAGRPLAIVTPGTVVGDRSAPRWNRLILASTPRIAAGDADSVPGAFRDRIDRFTLVLLATVRPVVGPDGTTRQVLDELGAGFAVPLSGRLTVVDTENPPAAAGIDFIGRQLLSQNGKSLVGLTCVGGSDTIQIFDAESILFRNGKHRDFVMRHFVWADPGSGECSFCVWLLEARPDGTLQAAEDPPRWVPSGTREDRAMHVDAREFLLGIPTRRAFALLDMPPGRQLQWSPALKEAAASRTWPPAAVQTLAAEINRGLQPLRASP